jgi:EmrB/QacA subfamily drug resistance transporter
MSAGASRTWAQVGRTATPSAAVFAVTALGGLVVSLDVSVANSLMPAIGHEFAGEGRAALSWVITAYAIVFAAALVPAGRIADRAGRRRTYLGGLALFAVGSLLCGVAPDLGVLLAGRIVQGLGAAAASPASLGLLLAACSDRHRATYAARWTGAAALGVCLGPFVGGVLTAAGDWRWAFLVNLPVIAGLCLATPRLLAETPRHPGRRLPDPLGAGMFALAAAGLALALSEMTTWGTTSARTLGSLGAAGLLTVAFVGRSRRVSEPMLQLTLLRNRRVVAAAVVAAGYAAGFFGFLLTFMLFSVEHWHLDLVQAGAALLPTGLVVVALTTQVGRLAERVGHRLLLTVGAGQMALALVACAATLGGDHLEARWFVVGLVLGLGIGLCYPVLAGAAVHGLGAADLAAASAINQCARQLGAAIGVAAAVGLLGRAPTPDLAHFHSAWLVAALFCAAAGAAAVLIPHPAGSGVASVTTPITTLEERSA